VTAVRPKLDIDTTRDRLMALGCTHAAEQLDQMLTEAVRQEIPAHNFLDRLLQAELSGREGRRVKTSLKLSNLPVGQTLENFDFAFQPTIERSRIDTLATCAWVRNGETVLVHGRQESAKRICWWDLGSARSNRGSRCSIFAATN
jgi:DNA replication protein DnaC